MKIPLHLTLDKWRRMSLTEQYEIVFSSQQSFKDPSRSKPQELPYFVRVVSRKAKLGPTSLLSSSEENEGPERGAPEQSRDSNSSSQVAPALKCIFCRRKKCSGCPLPFEDRMSLRNLLEACKAPLCSTHMYYDDDSFNQKLLLIKQQKQAH